jgi:hypothetical protein
MRVRRKLLDGGADCVEAFGRDRQLASQPANVGPDRNPGTM